MKVFLSGDPGQSGCFCALSEHNDIAFKDWTNSTDEMLDWLKVYQDSHNVVMTKIEDVHSIFGASAKSNFNFGRNFGIMIGLVRALRLPIAYVQPKIWQKHLGVKQKGKAIKKEVAEILCGMYPGLDKQLYTPRGRLIDGRSDALGIAHYCKFKHK